MPGTDKSALGVPLSMLEEGDTWGHGSAFSGCDVFQWEITGKHELTGCDLIQQEIIGKPEFTGCDLIQ